MWKKLLANIAEAVAPELLKALITKLRGESS
jgi:hypothetical protein